MTPQDRVSELDLDARKNFIQQYQPDAKRLVRYIAWLEEKRKGSVMNRYAGEGAERASFHFPIYDSTLMSFVKEAKETRFITRNYQYVYNRNRIKDEKQEKEAVQKATLKDIEIMSGIFSKYVLGGMTKGFLWAQGVENGIFLEVLYKLRELMGINEQQ